MLKQCVGGVLAVVVAAPVVADTRLRYVDEQSGEEQSVITIKGSKVRMDDAGSASWTLFDAADDSLIAVEPSERSYTSLDQQTMEKAAGQMNAALAEMRKELEQMPAEQRAMMEEMMGGMMDAGRQMVETKVEPTGKTLNKGGHQCQQVFMSVGTGSRSELCVVDPDELDIPGGDRQTLDAMQARMKKFAEAMSNTFGGGVGPTFDFDSLGGMPVYMKQDDEATGQVLEAVSHSDIDAGLFRIPDGYREEKVDIQ